MLFALPLLLVAQVGLSTPTVPGVTLRVFQLEGAPRELPKLVRGQTPNRDTLESGIDWTGDDFGGLPAPIYCEALAWLQVETKGSYRFRLTSDDGSRLVLDGATVLRHDGLHGATSKISDALDLAPGLHELRVEHFDAGGARVLRLEWQRPGAKDFEQLDASDLQADNDPARVTAPGVKQTQDDRKPGHGLPVAGVHPGWRVETLPTGDLVPKIGCLAFLPDGRLAFGTFDPLQRDEVSLPDIDSKPPDSLYAYDLTTGAIQTIATDLYEPSGICVVDGTLYVANRRAILRLEDRDGDGVYETREVVGSGWEGWNYHQFVFGMVARDGKLYANLSTSMGPPKWEGMENNSGTNGPLRGSAIEVDLSNHLTHAIAGGFRTPNGLGEGPLGSLVYLDNQGAWMPTSVLCEVIPGRFYGHYNWTRFVPMLKDRFPLGGHPSVFCDRMRTPPALYMPHNEVVNSPTQPVLIPDGPYAGQLLIGELTAGGIRRAALERVGGVLQGALFRFTQGLSCGVNRLAWGPDGALYIGGIGAGGNWNWQGTQSGLQRLVPTGKSVFEMRTIRATPDGFEIEFTQPIDRTWLANPANYTLQSWTYAPTQTYGGPKIDVRDHAVVEASPAPSGSAVRLRLGPLETDRCYGFRLDPKSLDGEAIWSGDAWYTLQQIPGATVAGTGLGALPPADATPLIQSAYPPAMAFEGADRKPAPRRQADFSAGSGYVEVGQGSGDLVSTTTHGDVQLHLEWYCPSGGEGELRSNSAVLLQGRYAIQISATPAGEAPSERSAGSMNALAVPLVNASTGPDTWQSYDICFRAPRFVDGAQAKAHISMLWNGVLALDDMTFAAPADPSLAGSEGPTGVLRFQDVGTQASGPVRLRNVWMRGWPATVAWRAGAWVDLLSQPGDWVLRGGEAVYTLENGVLVGETRPNTPNTFFTSVNEYDNFELTYEARIDPALNSGVQIRSEVIGGFDQRSGGLRGYQVELDPSERAWSAGLYEERGRGWLHPLDSAPYARRAFRQGEWNRFRVLAEGPRIRTWINGVPAADVYDTERSSGHFGFQVHGVGANTEPMHVEWRNVRLRKLTRFP